nr:hypothetical protein HK105_007768 [Polyrhizophydium stewartii]
MQTAAKSPAANANAGANASASASTRAGDASAAPTACQGPTDMHHAMQHAQAGRDAASASPAIAAADERGAAPAKLHSHAMPADAAACHGRHIHYDYHQASHYAAIQHHTAYAHHPQPQSNQHAHAHAGRQVLAGQSQPFGHPGAFHSAADGHQQQHQQQPPQQSQQPHQGFAAEQQGVAAPAAAPMSMDVTPRTPTRGGLCADTTTGRDAAAAAGAPATPATPGSNAAVAIAGGNGSGSIAAPRTPPAAGREPASPVTPVMPSTPVRGVLPPSSQQSPHIRHPHGLVKHPHHQQQQQQQQQHGNGQNQKYPQAQPAASAAVFHPPARTLFAPPAFPSACKGTEAAARSRSDAAGHRASAAAVAATSGAVHSHPPAAAAAAAAAAGPDASAGRVSETAARKPRIAAHGPRVGGQSSSAPGVSRGHAALQHPQQPQSQQPQQSHQRQQQQPVCQYPQKDGIVFFPDGLALLVECAVAEIEKRTPAMGVVVVAAAAAAADAAAATAPGHVARASGRGGVPHSPPASEMSSSTVSGMSSTSSGMTLMVAAAAAAAASEPGLQFPSSSLSSGYGGKQRKHGHGGALSASSLSSTSTSGSSSIAGSAHRARVHPGSPPSPPHGTCAASVITANTATLSRQSSDISTLFGGSGDNPRHGISRYAPYGTRFAATMKDGTIRTSHVAGDLANRARMRNGRGARVDLVLVPHQGEMQQLECAWAYCEAAILRGMGRPGPSDVLNHLRDADIDNDYRKGGGVKLLQRNASNFYKRMMEYGRRLQAGISGTMPGGAAAGSGLGVAQGGQGVAAPRPQSFGHASITAIVSAGAAASDSLLGAAAADPTQPHVGHEAGQSPSMDVDAPGGKASGFAPAAAAEAIGSAVPSDVMHATMAPSAASWVGESFGSHDSFDDAFDDLTDNDEVEDGDDCNDGDYEDHAAGVYSSSSSSTVSTGSAGRAGRVRGAVASSVVHSRGSRHAPYDAGAASRHARRKIAAKSDAAPAADAAVTKAVAIEAAAATPCVARQPSLVDLSGSTLVACDDLSGGLAEMDVIDIARAAAGAAKSGVHDSIDIRDAETVASCVVPIVAGKAVGAVGEAAVAVHSA